MQIALGQCNTSANTKSTILHTYQKLHRHQHVLKILLERRSIILIYDLYSYIPNSKTVWILYLLNKFNNSFLDRLMFIDLHRKKINQITSCNSLYICLSHFSEFVLTKNAVFHVIISNHS